ncbi:hypothetical protein LM602_00055 [Candidatus Acetothermia bacterium]|jgi:chromosome segregation ATPase|nr:hypothetical protein [Candidatus Acetothermia bacterium]MCI2430939.1 hypothetical protein [Candidatus Acetothermia bacterium]MCI2437039.1 hypothetical protein [Candidatus Acetothermia bacterium]
MKAAPAKKRPNVADLQKALDVFYAELNEEHSKVQELYHKLKQVQLCAEAYDQAWADLYVSLTVLETKARTLQEILDELSEQADDEEG